MSKINAQEHPKCLTCHTAVYLAKRKHATCVMCQKYFHFKCTDVTSEKYNAIAHNNNGFQWFCVFCTVGANNLFQHVMALEKKLEEQSARIDNLENKTNQTTAEELKENLSNLASTTEQSNPSAQHDEDEVIEDAVELLFQEPISKYQEASQPTSNEEKEKLPFSSLFQEEMDTTQSGDLNKSVPDSRQNLENLRPICQDLTKNQCFKGKGCPNSHPKTCKKFLNGGRFSHGCLNWNCTLLHPKICSKSYIYGSCHTRNCKETHTQESLQEQLEEEPAKIQNQSAAPSSQNFLWQSQMELKIGLLLDALKPQHHQFSQVKLVSTPTQEGNQQDQQTHQNQTRTRIIWRRTPRV